MIRVFKNKRVKTVVLLTLAVCVIAAAVGGYFLLRTRYIKLTGITLTPTQDFPIQDVTYFLQNDPKWAHETIGDTSSKMGGTGCLISCVASALCNLGENVTPQELNQKLTAINGFEGASLIWYKIHELFPSVDYEYNREFSSQTIEEELQNGRLPIINVKFYGIGEHWVMIIGVQNGEFMIYDPRNQDKTPIPLSKYGKVYAYRVLLKV